MIDELLYFNHFFINYFKVLKVEFIFNDKFLHSIKRLLFKKLKSLD
jgi:hypothetical protein